MAIPVLPETAPFSTSQRAWLNGFFAGLLGLDRGTNGHAANGHGTNGHAAALPAAPAEEDVPWHDPALKMDERLKLAEGKPPALVLMAAMAQLDCGACGYVCKTYSEAIVRGEETDLTKCSPGGKETSKKLKELVASRKALPTVEANGHHPSANGHAAKPSANGHAAPQFDRKNPFHAPLLECRPLTAPDSQKDVRFVAFTLRGSGLSYEAGDASG